MHPSHAKTPYGLAALATALIFAAGFLHPPQAQVSTGVGHACALAPRLSAATLPGWPANRPPIAIRANGQPVDFSALKALLKNPWGTPVTLEIGSARVNASCLATGGFAAVYKFQYPASDPSAPRYAMKLPRQFDSAASRLDSVPELAGPGGLLEWMCLRGYLRRAAPEAQGPAYFWTPAGRDAVLDDDPEFYSNAARLLPGPGGDAALRRCRGLFQRELQYCLSARREASGFARAYPSAAALQTAVGLPPDPSGKMLVPDAVVQLFFPSLLPLAKVQPGSQSGALVVRAAMGELSRIHRMGLVHGDMKPDHIIIDPGLGVRFTDWGCSHTPAQLRDGHVVARTPEHASPARKRWSVDAPGPYNPFFDDYYGLATSLAYAWTLETPEDLFAPSGRLHGASACYMSLQYTFPRLSERIRGWRSLGRSDVQAFTLALLEEAGCGLVDIPGYLVWGDPDRLYLTVNEIEREAAAGILGAAA